MTDLQHQGEPSAARTGPTRLYGPRFREDPAGLYAEIRDRHGPVAPVLLDGDVPAWFVCGYRELHQVTADAQLFARDTRRWSGGREVPDDWPLLAHLGYDHSVRFTEGPEHRRRAGAISDALAAVDQVDLGARCERIADRLIDTFAGSGEAELMSQYTERIPPHAAAVMCGMPETAAPALVEDLAGSLDASSSDSMPADDRAREAMRLLVASRRELPGPDLPSRLLADPANLSGEEIVLDMLVVLSATRQHTTNWIGNTIRLMLTDPHLATSLCGGRASVRDALNEVLWRDTPTQNHLGRVATGDTRLGGRRIRAGDLLVLGLAAANADPRVRREGGTGGNRAQLSFGHGEHGCPDPAPELAEIIARTSIEVLLDRLPDLTLAVPATDLRWRPSVWTRGLTRLPVSFTPTHVR